MQIRLWFSGATAPELYRLQIQTSPLAECREFVRGQTGGGAGVGSFPWTSGSHALALLFVQAAYRGSNPIEAHLAGGQGSPASALDFALSKRPDWLRELFGLASCGRLTLLRQLEIRNSNRKRPGPIEIWVKPGTHIEIFLDGSLLTTSAEVRKLAASLEETWRPYGKRRANVTAPSLLTAPSLIRLFTDEVQACLREVELFDRVAYQNRLKRLAANRSFLKVAGASPFSFAEDLVSLPPSLQRGTADLAALRSAAYQGQGKPIRVGVGMCNVGPLSLFSHLAASGVLPLEIDNGFVHALEIATRIIRQDPFLSHDLVAVASAPAASMIANRHLHDYVPVMLLPSARQHMVRARSADGRLPKANGGVMSLLFEEPSTASFYFDLLGDREVVKRKSFALVQHQPWETASLLASGDPDATSILFFPYAELNVAAGNCELIPPVSTEWRTAEMILFARREFVADRNRLFVTVAALRAAWSELLEDRNRQAAAVERFASAPSYFKRLSRASGLELAQEG